MKNDQKEPDLMCPEFDKILGILLEIKSDPKKSEILIDQVITELHVLEKHVEILRIWGHQWKILNETGNEVDEIALKMKLYRTQRAVRQQHYRDHLVNKKR